MMTNDKTITLRLPADLLATITRLAEAEGRSLADMIRRCCTLGVSRSTSLAKARKRRAKA